ncbi:MAG: 6-carboxytetrahydropterin synthase [Longimicrobiales bacterium]
MPIVSLTREISFAAAHRYHRPDWSDERNRMVFGACSNPHGHGHAYRLAVTVEGQVDPETGFAVNLVALDALLHAVVTVPLDHQHLNHVVPEFAAGAQIPTTENIAMYLWPRIAGGLPAGAILSHLRLFEDSTLYVDYRGERTHVV